MGNDMANAPMSFADRIVKRLKGTITGSPVRERIVVKSVDGSRQVWLKPGFIIGAYRSGTTLLRYVLDSHRNITVPPESNFLNGMAELWRDDWYRKGLEGVGVDEEGLRHRLRAFAGGVFDDYARAKGKQRWFDKTPSYVDTLDFVDAIFGSECRYIMLYRHGLDVANSMADMHRNDVNSGPGRRFADRFPDSARLTNACYWAEKCETMLAFEAEHPDQCFHIRYEQFAREPMRHLPPLFEFLGEEWDEGVLSFADKQHDFGLQDSKVLDSKGFRPNTDTYRAWPDGEIARAEEIIGPMLKRLGYSV
jgi:protein-tyrosine sulfotransferase